MGSPSVVGSLEEFQGSFNHFTGGLFERVDWSNIIVAGGATQLRLEWLRVAAFDCPVSVSLWQAGGESRPDWSFVSVRM